LPREIALQQKRDILWRHLFQRKLEKCLLGLEVTNLQQSIDLFQDTPSLQSQGVFSVGHRKKIDTLKVVKIGNAIERCLLCFRENGQSLVAITAHVALL
jgi:hypothetical protein